MSQHTYAEAGVDIAAGTEAVNRIKPMVESTFSSSVIGGLGGFGAMFDLKAALQEYQHPIMVQSIDGVGTKTIIARMAKRYDTLGHDLLSACANDIVVTGAKPLTLLDYIANDHMEPATIEQLLRGMTAACRQHQVSLVGGEMAEMPDTYLPGEHDLVGIVTGVVEKNHIIDGKRIQPGDKIIGLASNGLHTNGYSLARHLLFKIAQHHIHDNIPGDERPLSDTLLAPHINYAPFVHQAMASGIDIKGMAHITGGGLIENLPRILPHNCSATIQLDTWSVPAIFDYLRRIGELEQQEQYRTFNMGIGWVIVAAPDQVPALRDLAQQFPEHPLYEIGTIDAGNRGVQLQR